MVYLFSGSGTLPTDINGEADPDMVAIMDDMNKYAFGFVVAGDYTVSLVCNVVDDPEAEDTLDFLTSRNVTVTASETVTADLPVI